MRHRSIWVADQAAPRSIATLLFAPGTDAVVEQKEAVIHQVAAIPEDASVAWRPEPGDTVLDHRFGRVVRYQVETNGGTPSEEKLRLEAERSGPGPEARPVLFVTGSSNEPSHSGPSGWARPVAWAAAAVTSLFLGVRMARSWKDSEGERA
jgi:hypothetical protein